MMWIAVLFTSVYGPDFVSVNGATSTTIPSGIFVGLFALLGSGAVARYGFRRGER